MEQNLLKNIYEAFGSLRFEYKGKRCFVSYNEETDEYKLLRDL